MKIKAWLNSNANVHSKKTIEFDIEDEEWNNLAPGEQDEFVRECVFEYLDWGYEIID